MSGEGHLDRGVRWRAVGSTGGGGGGGRDNSARLFADGGSTDRSLGSFFFFFVSVFDDGVIKENIMLSTCVREGWIVGVCKKGYIVA